MTRWIYMVEWAVYYPASTYLMRYATETFRFPSVAPSSWGTPAYQNINGVATYSNLVVHGRVRGFPSVQSNMFGSGGTRGDISIDSGSVVLENADGALDRIQQYSCEGRQVRIIRINADDVSDYSVVWHGTAEGYDVDESTVTIRLRGFQYLLDRTMMVNKYAGTGGLEGGAELTGKPKPFLLGQVYNVKPVLVDPVKCIYQLDGQIGELFGFVAADLLAYDKRAALTYGGAYANTTDLQDNALAPAAGAYKVFPGPGGIYFRLNAKPVGEVTCDVINAPSGYEPQVVAPGFSGFSTNLECHYLLWVLVHWWELNELSGITLRVADGAKVTDPASQDGGIYFTDETTYMEAANLLLRSIGGALYFNMYEAAFDQMRPAVAQIVSNSSGDLFEIADHEIEKGSLRVIPPSDPERGAPLKKLTVNYKRNYLVMGAQDVDGTVSDADRATLEQEWLSFPKAGYAPAITAYPSASTIVYDTALYALAGATDLAEDVIFNIYDRENCLFSVEIEASKFDDFFCDSGRTYTGVVFGKRTRVRIAYPQSRYGLTGTIDFWVIGYERLADREAVRLILLPPNLQTGSAVPEQ